MKNYLVIAIIAAATATAAVAHNGVKNPDVLNRMNGMSDLAKGMKTIGMMAKGQSVFNAKEVNQALSMMSQEAAKIPALFETKADDPKSEARAVIWENYSDFSKKADSLEEITASLAGTVKDRADLGAVMQQVGKTCSACHGAYRK
mgnify:CR=1 FL=1